MLHVRDINQVYNETWILGLGMAGWRQTGGFPSMNLVWIDLSL